MGVDFGLHYCLATDLSVFERDHETVQVGTVPPRRMLIIDAPPRTALVLREIDGSRRMGDVIASHDGDPLVWRYLTEELIAHDLLMVDDSSPEPAPGPYPPLAQQHGLSAARRIATARADAIVSVEGDGDLAETIADLLAGSGLGAVHHSSPRGRSGAPLRDVTVIPGFGGPVRVRRSSPIAHPTLVVLVSPGRPDPGRAAELMLDMTPHLAVSTASAQVVVGPLVLPGWTPCLGCLDHHRRAADPAWPMEAEWSTRSGQPFLAATTLLAAAAGTADQVLTLIDGQQRPTAVSTTMEYAACEVIPRYRHWTVHEECRCRLLGAR